MPLSFKSELLNGKLRCPLKAGHTRQVIYWSTHTRDEALAVGEKYIGILNGPRTQDSWSTMEQLQVLFSTASPDQRSFTHMG